MVDTETVPFTTTALVSYSLPPLDTPSAEHISGSESAICVPLARSLRMRNARVKISPPAVVPTAEVDANATLKVPSTTSVEDATM